MRKAEWTDGTVHQPLFCSISKKTARLLLNYVDKRKAERYNVIYAKGNNAEDDHLSLRYRRMKLLWNHFAVADE